MTSASETLPVIGARYRIGAHTGASATVVAVNRKSQRYTVTWKDGQGRHHEEPLSLFRKFFLPECQA